MMSTPTPKPNLPVRRPRRISAGSDGAAYLMSPGMPGATPAADDAPGFVEYWQMLWRRKLAVLVFGVLGCIVTLGIGLMRQPLYEGRVSLEFQETNADFLNMRNLDPTASTGAFLPDAYISTQGKVLESRALIEAVVDQLKIADDFQGEKWWTRWLRATGIQYESLPWFRRVPPRERAIEEVSKSLRVKTTPSNRVVEISFEWSDPKTAADLANTLASTYISKNVEARWKATEQTGDWLAKQLGSTRSKLEALEAEIQAYSRTSDLLFTSDKESVSGEKLRQVQAELSRAQADRAIRQASYDLSQSAVEALPEVQDNAQLKDYASKLGDMRRQLAELNLALTPTHYRVVRLKAQIEEQERAIEKERTNIVARIRNEYERSGGREKLLSALYQVQAEIVADQAGKRAHYNVLMREVETNRRMYDSMLEKVRDAGVAAAIRASNIRVVDPATPATRPSKPKLALNALGGIFSGLLLAFGYILFSERANRTFRAPDEVARYLGTVELGTILAAGDALVKSTVRPTMANGSLLRLGAGHDQPKPLELFTWHERPSMFAESIRTVLTSVMFNYGDSNRPKVLVVTSPAPREGKTTVTTNLAIAITELGLKVVLVDCDLRQSRLHNVFELPNSWGVSSLVTGELGLADCPLNALVQSTKIPSLYVLTSGPGTSSVSGVLSSSRFPALLERLRKEFDVVLIDTPPVLPFADARMIGRMADGVIIVVRANRTDRADALAAAQRLFEDGTPIAGAVLNDWNPKGSRYAYKSHGYTYS